MTERSGCFVWQIEGWTHLLTQLYWTMATGTNTALSSMSKRGNFFSQYFSGLFFAEISCSRGQEEPVCRDSKPKLMHLMRAKPWGVGLTMTFGAFCGRKVHRAAKNLLPVQYSPCSMSSWWFPCPSPSIDGDDAWRFCSSSRLLTVF